MSPRLRPGVRPPRVGLVQAELDRFEAARYLEIGVHTGTVFANVRAKRKVGVDPVNRIGLGSRVKHPIAMRGAKMLEMPSRTFFDGLAAEERFDVVFIDGDHRFEAALADIESALTHLDPEGVILVHDCNPTSPAMAADEPGEGSADGWCGTVWKAIAFLRASRSDLDVSVVDTDYGIGIIRFGSSEGIDLDSARVAELSYRDLDRDRERLLGLQRAPSRFSGF